MQSTCLNRITVPESEDFSSTDTPAGVTVAPEKRVSSWTLTIASPPRS